MDLGDTVCSFSTLSGAPRFVDLAAGYTPLWAGFSVWAGGRTCLCYMAQTPQVSPNYTTITQLYQGSDCWKRKAYVVFH